MEPNENNDDTTNRTISMLKNGISIERRVKKELIEQGLLDPEDFTKVKFYITLNRFPVFFSSNEF